MICWVLYLTNVIFISSFKDPSETLVRTKRIPSEDDYDYIKDFQKDEAEHSSPIRKQRDATENSTLVKNNAKDDIDNVFNNLVDKSKPGQYNKMYQQSRLTQNPTSITKNVSINPRNEIEKFFSDIASKNEQTDGNHQISARTGRQAVEACNKSIETGCGEDLDNIFKKIVEKSTVSNSSHEDESEFQAIDNVFSNLVEKTRQHSTHVNKRNINKPKDNSANNFEKLRKMFEVMNKRSVEEDDDDSVIGEGDKMSGDFESGSGRDGGKFIFFIYLFCCIFAGTYFCWYLFSLVLIFAGTRFMPRRYKLQDRKI